MDEIDQIERTHVVISSLRGEDRVLVGLAIREGWFDFRWGYYAKGVVAKNPTDPSDYYVLHHHFREDLKEPHAGMIAEMAIAEYEHKNRKDRNEQRTRSNSHAQSVSRKRRQPRG